MDNKNIPILMNGCGSEEIATPTKYSQNKPKNFKYLDI